MELLSYEMFFRNKLLIINRDSALILPGNPAF
jgi:hypothetical protein